MLLLHKWSICFLTVIPERGTPHLVSTPATHTGRQDDTEKTREHAERVTCWPPRTPQGVGVEGGESVITFLGQVRGCSFSRCFYTNRHKERSLVKWCHIQADSGRAGAFAKSIPEAPLCPPSLAAMRCGLGRWLLTVYGWPAGQTCAIFQAQTTQVNTLQWVSGSDLQCYTNCQSSGTFFVGFIREVGDRRNGPVCERKGTQASSTQGAWGHPPCGWAACAPNSSGQLSLGPTHAIMPVLPLLCVPAHTQQVLESHPGNTGKHRNKTYHVTIFRELNTKRVCMD